MLQFCSLYYFSKFLKFFSHGTLAILPIWQATYKAAMLPFEGTVVTTQHINFGNSWIASPLTSLTEGSCMMHQHTVHSELGPGEPGPHSARLSLSSSGSACLGGGSYRSLGAGWEDGQCCGRNRALLLYYFSAGSRTIFTQTGKNNNKNQKLSWRTTISLSFVWLDGKTNGQVPQLAALTTGKQRRLPVN